MSFSQLAGKLQLIQVSTKYENSTFIQPKSLHFSCALYNCGHTFVCGSSNGIRRDKNAQLEPSLRRKIGFGRQVNSGVDRDQVRARPGDLEGGPLLAALEDYAHRAYPAKDVPMQATLNAITSFRQVRARSMGRPTAGGWQLIGPSKADAPDLLTFSGADYTTSGRVTALAIDPSCGRRRCTGLGRRRGRWRVAHRQCTIREWFVLDVCVGQLRHECDRDAHVRSSEQHSLRWHR